MTGPAAPIECDPKESGRRIGIANPLPRVCRCTPMLLQQGNACPFEPAGGGSDRHTPRSRLLGRRTIITRFGALGAPTTTYDNIENTHLFRPRRDQCIPVCISVCIPKFRPIEHLKSVTLIAPTAAAIAARNRHSYTACRRASTAELRPAAAIFHRDRRARERILILLPLVADLSVHQGGEKFAG